jgi:hypothetical protein
VTQYIGDYGGEFDSQSGPSQYGAERAKWTGKFQAMITIWILVANICRWKEIW